jgi:hypothetical protein
MKYSYGKITKRAGGGSGGGGSTTTSQNVPPELMPYLVNANQNAQGMFQSGNLSQVAGATGNQQAAFGGGGQAIAQTGGAGLDTLSSQQARLSSMAMAPSAATLDAQKNAIVLDAQKATAGINSNFGQNGALGSARSAVMQGAQNADTTGKLAQVNADYENKMFQNRLQAESAIGSSVGQSSQLANATASGLANLGNQERGINQSQLDAGWQGLQRYASTVYGNPARQTTTQSGGGGK